MKANLEIRSFSGRVYGASHYWGTLRIGSESHEVQHTLTVSEARKMTKDDRRDGEPLFRWKAGMETERFTDEQSLIAAAIAFIEKEHPSVRYLLHGSHCVCDPQRVLMGDEPLKSQLSELYARAEANDFWEGDEEVMEQISAEWRLLLAKL